MSSVLPKKISRYQIVSELGRGAMGVVYKATDPNIGRAIALKTMRIDVHGVDEAEILRRFKHEAVLAGVMNHPNIVTIYDAGEFEGVFYIAMEHIEGVTLHNILHQQRVIPIEQIINISKAACTGLDYAHERQVIHRDIKPANIMIGHDGTVKIMDFGIAKSGATMTTAGQVLGTPTYMSPEQVRGRQLDGRSDLFSYGVCLYEMVTGEKPFTGQNVTTIIYKIMHEAPIPPRELDVSIHPGLSAMIVKSLSKNPDERYQSGAEMIYDLIHYKSYGSGAVSTKLMAAPETGIAARAVAAAATLTKLAAATPAPEPTPDAVTTAAVLVDETPGDEQNRNSAKLRLGVLASKKWYQSPLTIVIPILLVAVVALAVLKRTRIPQPQLPSTLAAVPHAPTTEQQSSSAAATTTSTPQHGQILKTDSKASAAKATTTEKSTIDPAPAASPVVIATVQPTPPVVPPKSTVPNTGGLRIGSVPSGARVSISGVNNPAWVTPFTVADLEAGTYELTFTHRGYITKTEEITVAAGRIEPFTLNLGKAGGEIIVTSDPPGGEIYLNGRETNRNTPATLAVEKGKHKIEVRRPGYREEETILEIRDGDSLTFAPLLEPVKADGKPRRAPIVGKLFGGGKVPEGKGILVIKSKPQGADIYHNGQKIEFPTPIRQPMNPGMYRFTLRKDGYKPAHREFRIAKGRITEFTVQLEKR